MKQLDKLAPAVVALQSSLAPVGKSAANPFFKSRYAPLPEVRAALQPLLAANGLALLTFPTIIYDEDGGLHNGLRFYLMHESGQYIDGEWMLTPAKHDPQGEGSDVTYKRRYAEMAITGAVADEDDDGNAAALTTTARPKRAAAPRETNGNSPLAAAKSKLREAIKSAGVASADYVWVASATDADIARIEGEAEALMMGKVIKN
jgi:hypothetical protein